MIFTTVSEQNINVKSRCIFVGQNGVMVNTIMDLGRKFPHINSTTYFNKLYFGFKAQSREYPVQAILCEKGKVLNDISGCTH